MKTNTMSASEAGESRKGAAAESALGSSARRFKRFHFKVFALLALYSLTASESLLSADKLINRIKST